MIFYEIGCYVIRNGGLNKKLNTTQWKLMSLGDLLHMVQDRGHSPWKRKEH